MCLQFVRILGHGREMRFRRAVVSLISLTLLAASAPSFAAAPAPKKASATPVTADKIPEEAAKLIEEAIAKGRAQKFPEAVDLLMQAVNIIEKKLGKDHYLLGNSLNLLAQIEMILGHLDVAEKHADRSIAILRKDINADPLRLGHAMVRRAELHGRRGEGERELENRNYAVLLFQKAFGPESTDAMAEILALARACRKWGFYKEARTYFEDWIQVIEKKFGPNEPVLFEVLLDMGMNEADRGRYADAEKFLLRAMEIRKVHGRVKDEDIEEVLNNLAEIKYQQGDYATAEALYERVLAVYEVDPKVHPQSLGIILGNLGGVRVDRGDVQGGIALLQRSVDIQEKHFGPTHAAMATPLSNLGEALLRIGKYAEAALYLERALAIREKALGPDHPKLAAPLINVGSLWLEQGDNARAEPYFTRVLALQEKAFGTRNPLLFPTLQALGIIEQGKKNLDKAEAYHLRAAEVLEKAFGPTHPNLTAPLRSLATIQRLRGELDKSRTTLERASDIGEKHTARMLAGGSEAQKLAWLSTLDPLWEQIVDHHLQAEPQNVTAARLAFDATLRRKGRALDAVAGSLSLLRRNMSPDTQRLFEQLREQQKQLAAKTMHASDEKNLEAWATEILRLEKEVERLETLVAEQSTAYRVETQRATIATVQQMLPPDAMYVEIIRRRLATIGYFPKGTSEQYAAYVIGPTGEPRAIELGDAGPIDDAVFKLREALSDPARKDAKSLSRALDEKILRPIRPYFGTSKRLVISPDGALNFIPFEALADENGKFLIEGWSISYVTSGRDLFRWGQRNPSRSGAVIVANPAFGEIIKKPGGESNTTSRGVDRTGISRLGFTPLSGTAQEAQAIMNKLSGATLYAGDNAEKNRLLTVKGPKILHVATHGFFLGDTVEQAAAHTRGFTLEGEAPPAAVQTVEDLDKHVPDKPSPLLRSGLALAHANARGDARSDGILTALEASSLDLEGTKLVVLSACETGLGQARSGEGVEGLRRAFVLAGAETTVMSLWKVDDEATRDMMVNYYQRLEAGGGRSESMREVRLAMLANDATAHPFYWASFIVAGNPGRFDGSMPEPVKVKPGARGCSCRVGENENGAEHGAAALLVLGSMIGIARRRRLS